MTSPTSAPSLPDAPGTVLQLLRSFLQVQQQRAGHYASLDRAFRAFLETKQELAFRKALQEATAAFNACSLQVIATESSLKGKHQRPDLAALLRTVQEQEREKLRLTLSLQSLRQAYAFEALAFQRMEADEDADPLEPPAPRTCGCGQGVDGSQGEHHHHHHHVGQDEPTRAEFEGAVKEAQLLLDASVQSINAVIEEVREILLEEAQE